MVCGRMYAQRTEVYTPLIRTVQVIANNDYMAPAVIRLGEDETMEISFDYLTHEYHRYQYILTHCNADWAPSDLSETEYLDGFKTDISGCRKPDDLPEAALKYVRYIENAVGCPVACVSVGAGRDEYLLLK